MNKKSLLPLAVLTSLLAGGSAQAANLVIDSFTGIGTAFEPFPGIPLSLCTVNGFGQCVYLQEFGGPGATHPVDNQAISSVTGGWRQLEIVSTATPPLGSQLSSFGITDPNLPGVNPQGIGVARLFNAGGASSLSRLTYNANGAGLNIDSSSFGGFDSFDIVVPSSDLGLDVTLTLATFGGGTGSMTLFNVGGGSNTSTTVSFDLSDPLFSAVDFNNIDLVSIDLFGDADLDAEIDLLSFIMTPTPPPVGTPEPATMLGLLAVGAMGFASRRRQK